MIYISYELVLKNNSQIVWLTWIEKHNSIKSEYKISQVNINLFDADIFIQNNKTFIGKVITAKTSFMKIQNMQNR